MKLDKDDLLAEFDDYLDYQYQEWECEDITFLPRQIIKAAAPGMYDVLFEDWKDSRGYWPKECPETGATYYEIEIEPEEHE